MLACMGKAKRVRVVAGRALQNEGGTRPAFEFAAATGPTSCNGRLWATGQALVCVLSACFWDKSAVLGGSDFFHC